MKPQSFRSRTMVATLCLAAFNSAQAADPFPQQRDQSQTPQPWRQELEALKKRVEAAEHKATAARNLARQAHRAALPPKRANAFNPAISLILNGAFSSYSRPAEDYALPGFALGPEAGLEPEGLSLAESEITLAANTDPWWRGQLTLSLGNDHGETTTESTIATAMRTASAARATSPASIWSTNGRLRAIPRIAAWYCRVNTSIDMNTA